jgi:aminoglycoside phosphotransferase (APT) family kinase protein
MRVSRDEIGRLLNDLSSAHHLWRPDPDHQLLSLGAENLAIDVTGDFIVRINVQPPRERAASVGAEAALLRRLQPLIDIEVPDLLVAEQVSGLMIYRRLPGRPYLVTSRTGPDAMTDPLGRVLHTMHQLTGEVDVPDDHHPMDAWLADARSTAVQIDAHLRPEHRVGIRQLLTAAPPPDTGLTLLCHNDLGAEHLLVDDSGALTGIIDWTDAAHTDPARDIAAIYRDLGPAVAVAVAQAAEIPDPAVMQRAHFLARCKWIEDFAYAVENEPVRRPYLENAHRTFRHTFAAT